MLKMLQSNFQEAKLQYERIVNLLSYCNEKKDIEDIKKRISYAFFNEDFEKFTKNGLKVLIKRNFILASPIWELNYKVIQEFQDEIQVLVFHLFHEFSYKFLIKDISNYTQRLTYEFWKERGFRKMRQGKKVLWGKKEKKLRI